MVENLKREAEAAGIKEYKGISERFHLQLFLQG